MPFANNIISTASKNAAKEIDIFTNGIFVVNVNV